MTQNVLKDAIILAGLGVLFAGLSILAGGRLGQVLGWLCIIFASATLTLSLIWL